MNTKNISIERKLELCKKQARRLASSLSVSRTVAQYLLAKGVYRCGRGWKDLKSTIEKSSQSNRRLELLSINPNSSVEDIEKLRDVIPDIATDIHQLVLHSRDMIGLHTMVWRVFGFKDKYTELDDVFTTLPGLAWRSAELGVDPAAVIYADVELNDVAFRLLGTRVHMPEYYDWASEEELDFIWGERSLDREIQIIWSEPDKWEAEQRGFVEAFLQNTDDEDVDEPDFPLVTLDEDMLVHTAWFDQANERWSGGDDSYDSQLLPIQFNAGVYLIYGFPISRQQACQSIPSVDIPLEGDPGNDSMVVLMGKQPIGLEFIGTDSSGLNHIGEFEEYFDEIYDNYFSHPLCRVSSVSGPYDSHQLVLFRPAAPFCIEQRLKMKRTVDEGVTRWILKTDNIERAIEIVEKIYARECYVSPDREDNGYFYMKHYFDCQQDHGLSISFEYQTVRGWSCMNLISSSTARRENDGELRFLSICNDMLKITRMLPKKDILNALRYGLVISSDEGFIRSVMDGPCPVLSKLPCYPKGDRAGYSWGATNLGSISLSELFANTYQTVYEKDGF